MGSLLRGQESLLRCVTRRGESHQLRGVRACGYGEEQTQGESYKQMWEIIPKQVKFYLALPGQLLQVDCPGPNQCWSQQRRGRGRGEEGGGGEHARGGEEREGASFLDSPGGPLPPRGLPC